MAAGYISKPGSEFGPCLNECHHVDCMHTRVMSAAICHYCKEEIGYDVAFYNIQGKQMVHAVCHETAVEEELKRMLIEVHADVEKGGIDVSTN